MIKMFAFQDVEVVARPDVFYRVVGAEFVAVPCGEQEIAGHDAEELR